jgi:hypothetical protein
MPRKGRVANQGREVRVALLVRLARLDPMHNQRSTI